MMKYKEMNYIFFVCSLIVMVVYGSKDLPSDFPRCHRGDKKLNDCIAHALESAKPFIAKGIPRLNLPPFEPLFIEKIYADQKTQALDFKANLTNVLVHGLTDYTCPSFEFDVPNLQFRARCLCREIKLVSNYDIQGKILGAPVVGKGNLTSVFGNGEANLTETVEILEKRGVDYLKVQETKISIAVGKVVARLDGLFDGDEKLGELTNKLINDNADEIFRQTTPFFEELLTTIIEDILLKALAQVPYDKLFPK
ncbi:protein takeout-like isoform X1 [Leptinotarsa decemlineata]|uniref:protein takeout-like isoform X1 n=1 Tax=Leptinotarsa decemlineata TaxID=7539 RepID=UPI003D305823